MGFGFCHVILGNRGGPAQGWFSEEWLPAQALVGGDMPPTQGGASSGLGPGLQQREGAWRGQSPLVSWKRKLLQPKFADSSGEMEGLCGVFFFPESLPSDHVALFCYRNQESGVRCMFTLPGRSTTTNRKSRSVPPAQSWGEVGSGCVISRSRKH